MITETLENNMITVTPANGKLDLGCQGENLARRVVLKLDHVKKGPGQPILLYKRFCDQNPYPVDFRVWKNHVVWLVTNVDTLSLIHI